MKPVYTICAILFALMISETKFEKSLNYNEILAPNGGFDTTHKTDEIKNSGWFLSAKNKIREEEYYIDQNKETKSYQSTNRANNIRFIYNKNGFIAKLRNNKINLSNNDAKLTNEANFISLDEWHAKFSITGLGKTGTQIRNSDLIEDDFLKSLEKSEMRSYMNKASVENENLIINYNNDENGMRQDFIVKRKPEGEENLRIDISAKTNLKMTAENDAILFKDKNNVIQLMYSSLKVWDKEGKILEAKFEKTSDYNFSIVVNDEYAEYPVTIDPLSSSPVWSTEANQAGAEYGFSVATAGDVNNDGYSDVIVGAPFYDNGLTDEGKVFLYLGSANGLSSTPAWTAEGEQQSALFGYSVSTAGLFNADAYSDVVIGSPTYDNGQADEGRVFIYLGTPSGLSTTPSGTFETNQAGENCGYRVACAGDYDQNNLSDIVIGAPFYDNGQSNEGRLYVFSGNVSGLFSSPWVYESNQESANLGFSAGTAGDVNGDGYSDLIAGAYRYDGVYNNEGRVFIFHGSATGFPSSPNAIRSGTQAVEYFGYSVHTAGDVNADGYCDVIVGAPLFDNGQTDEGKACVYLGSSTGIASTPVWTADGNQVSGQYGVNVSTAGDMNGDGYADIIVGGNLMDFGETDEGAMYLHLGYSGGINNNYAGRYEGNSSNAHFGECIAIAGDVNGDGLSDIIAGAPKYDNPELNEGGAFVYYGSVNSMSETFSRRYNGSQVSSGLGTSVSTAGDVNGDGYADIIMGQPYYDNGQINEGRALVMHGGLNGLSGTSNWLAEGNQDSCLFGYSVSTAGDVNGDGYSDVIVGAKYYHNGQTDEGKVFVYYGSSTGLSSIPAWTIEFDSQGAEIGQSVSTAGDVNGDGFSDILFSSHSQAFVFFGSSTGLGTTSDWHGHFSAFSTSSTDHKVASAGDVNGDGYSDVILCEEGYDGGDIFDRGKVYVSYGSPTGPRHDKIYDWTAEGYSFNQHFGSDASGAGDVNGDGYSDIIIGASGFSQGSLNEGRIYIFKGSSTGLISAPLLSYQSDQPLARLGTSVSAAGDVNGDGYSDIISGAPYYDTTVIDQGRLFIFLGSSTVPVIMNEWLCVGDQAGSFLGSSVASSGDVNGDGYSDIIAGAGGFDMTYTDDGAVYSFYGGNNTSGYKILNRQFKYGTSNVVSSGMNSGGDGQINLSQNIKSPYGTGICRMSIEVKENSIPFSGTNIANSVGYTHQSNFLTQSLTGSSYSLDIAGLDMNKLYKWRSRPEYQMGKNPFQKYGPWNYYNNYIPVPHGNFRAKVNSPTTLNVTMLIQGFYRPESNSMIPDTAQIILRNSSSPYNVIDTTIVNLNSSGMASLVFTNAQFGTQYYIQTNHRNSIETWSTIQQINGTSLNYDFTTSASQAFGNNMIQVNVSPVRFAIYSGDVNQDGVVDASDAGAIDNDAYNFAVGYVATDLTGDEVVDATDAAIADNNAFNFVAKATP